MPQKILVTMTGAQLRNVAERVERVAASLRALEAAMKVQGFETLDVSSHDLMIRSIAGLESFDKAAWNAHHEVRESLDHYGKLKGKGPRRER